MVEQTVVKAGTVFPFKLEDLKSWIVHRKDGTVTRFTLVQSTVQKGDTVQRQTTHYQSDTSAQTSARVTSGYGSFCTHKPGDTPSAVFVKPNGDEIRLQVASVAGARATKNAFDVVVDCGDIFEPWQFRSGGLLAGDDELVKTLGQYCTTASGAKLLKIDWEDRAAPKVEPEFWVKLNEQIKGDVMTACIGGHGRSGSSFVCLTLVNAPDYDALDAIVHLRAVHCPRAIESVVQHEYIDKVAEYLGRKANAKEAHAIHDYKAVFKASTKPTAVATRKRLGWDQ